MSGRKQSRLWLALAAVIVAVPWIRESWAQSRAPAAGAAQAAAQSSVLRIRKLPKLGKSLLVRSPEYSSNVARTLSGSKRPREWAMFDLFYETQPDWVNELAFSFVIMSETRTPEGKKEYSLFRTTVTYVDIEKGEHLATVVLPPAAVARFGEIVAYSVEVAIGGQKLAEDSVTSLPSMPPDWWRNPRVIDNANVVKREGYLVDRSKTPFSYSFIDDYEAVK